MIRVFLWFCLFLVFGATIHQLLATASNYLLIVWGQTSIEMSLSFAVACLLAFILSACLLFTLFRRGFRGAKSVKNQLGTFRDRKAQQKTLDGLIDYIEGDWISARKKLTGSASKAETPLLNYLAGARSAYEMGDEQAALELLHKAEHCTDKGGLAVPIIQARMQLANGRYEQAMATLERASAISPEHPVVLSLRQQVCVALKDWKSLKALLPKLEKNHIGTVDSRRQLEFSLYREQFQEAQEKSYTLSLSQQKTLLKKLWSELPAHLQQEQWFLTYYASQLMTLGEHDEAEKVLARGLKTQWHGQWLDLYGLLICEDRVKPLKTAETWLTKHNNSSHLLLALGRLCMRNQQWGRAVSFLQKSLHLQKRPETFAELARALEYMGEHGKSHRCYKDGLLASSSALAHL